MHEHSARARRGSRPRQCPVNRLPAGGVAAAERGLVVRRRGGAGAQSSSRLLTATPTRRAPPAGLRGAHGDPRARPRQMSLRCRCAVSRLASPSRKTPVGCAPWRLHRSRRSRVTRWSTVRTSCRSGKFRAPRRRLALRAVLRDDEGERAGVGVRHQDDADAAGEAAGERSEVVTDRVSGDGCGGQDGTIKAVMSGINPAGL